MNDETGTTESTTQTESTSAPAPTTGEAWDAVLASMSDFGVAVTAWAGAATAEPETKERLDQVRSGIDDIGDQLDAAVGRAARSQTGQAIGDAAHAVAEATAPTLKNVFSGLSDMFGRAANRVDETMKTSDAEPAPVESAAVEPTAPDEPTTKP